MDDKIKLRKLKRFAPNDSGVNGVAFSKSEIKPLPMAITLETPEPLVKMAELMISECSGGNFLWGSLARGQQHLWEIWVMITLQGNRIKIIVTVLVPCSLLLN